MKIKLSEDQIARIVVNKEINEAEDFSVDKERKTSTTEKSIRDVFGSYGVHLTNDLIRYIRKNPTLIIKRLKDLYPEKFEKDEE
jgi:hypothetical protein